MKTQLLDECLVDAVLAERDLLLSHKLGKRSGHSFLVFFFIQICYLTGVQNTVDVLQKLLVEDLSVSHKEDKMAPFAASVE